MASLISIAPVLAVVPFLNLIIGLIIVGVLLYVVETLVPLDPTIRKLIHVVIVVAFLLYLLSMFGAFAGIG